MNDQTTPQLEAFKNQFANLAGVIEPVIFQPKIYINSFPKSGTHLANLIVAHLAHRQEDRFWMGSFRGNSWTTIWVNSNKLIPIIDGQNPATWYQGHLGYKPEFEEAFLRNNVCMFFIYRDLRDIVVSLAYHIETADDETHFHPGAEKFRELGGHKEIMKAVITGLDVWSGIFERWELYSKWLECDWVLPIRFEDMISDPKGVAERAIRYTIKRTIGETFLTFETMFQAAVERSIELQKTKDHSPSFRKGVAGEWKNEFDQELIDLFNEYDRNNWIKRLGYE